MQHVKVEYLDVTIITAEYVDIIETCKAESGVGRTKVIAVMLVKCKLRRMFTAKVQEANIPHSIFNNVVTVLNVGYDVSSLFFKIHVKFKIQLLLMFYKNHYR